LNPTLVLAAACLILCVGFGVRASFGLFLQPMSLEFGWGREVFSFAMALQNLLWGALGPLAGGIADRWGAGRVVAAGGACYVLGLLAMAFSGTPLALQLGSGFLIGLALAGATFGVVLTAIARVTPPEKRSMALGIATAAGSFGQFALLPAAQLFIETLDWQGALFALAAVTASIIPLAAAMRGRPPAAAPGSQSLAAALREAWRERGFHLLFWGYFVCGFQLLMFTVHLPSYVTDAGLGLRHGMMAVAIIGLFNIMGCFAFGWAGGRYSKKYLLSGIYFVRGGLILFLISFPLTPLTLYVFAAGMGLTWLSTVPLTNGLVGQIFGLRYMAMLTGIVFFGHQIGSFAGIWLAGWLFDTTGSYNVAFTIAVGLGLFAALVNLPVNETPIADRQPRAVPA
jgi:MFS family permease